MADFWKFLELVFGFLEVPGIGAEYKMNTLLPVGTRVSAKYHGVCMRACMCVCVWVGVVPLIWLVCEHGL